MRKTILILLLLMVSFAAAESGCYLNKESVFYCVDLEREDALGDCLESPTCVLGDVFFEGQSCDDIITFSECEEIYCRSNCDYEYRGKCLGGEIPLGEEYNSCTPGCCRFESYGLDFCDYKRTKWFCEVEAENKEASGFNFEIMDEVGCQDLCSKTLLSGIVAEGLEFEEVQEPSKGVEVERPEQTVVPELISEPTVTEESEGMNIWFWFVLVAILVLVIIYLLYRPRRRVERAERRVERKPRFFVRRREMRKEAKRRQQEERKEKHEMVERKREELFRIFGEPKPKELTYVDLLEKAVKVHELRKGRWRKTERDIFEGVEEVIKKFKVEEESLKEMTEVEAKDIFERLRKIIEKRH